MATNSKIEWTTHTFNPWRGCSKVSEGCKFCYADTLSLRNPGTLGVWGKNGTRVVASESMWREPLKWNRAAQEAGERHRVFCASLADVFEGRDTMPEASWEAVEAARIRLLDLIRQTPHLDWLLLTKRPENIGWHLDAARSMAANQSLSTAMWLDDWIGGKAPANVWLGTSVENQEAADKRIPELLQVPARVRFLSCEPLLGPVEFSNVSGRSDWKEVLGKKALTGIHWVIAGGESGPSARPMHPDWARSLCDQCQAAGVAFHFKQWGEFAPRIVNPPVNTFDGLTFPDKEVMTRVGKKNAGRLLDGRTWDELPEVTN